jgi:ribosome-binding factor A
MLSYKRSARVGALLQEEISKIIQEIKNPQMGFVTVTGIKLTDDLQQARVFYSVIGNEETVQHTADILKESIPEIRHKIAERMNLRRVPSVLMQYDETPAKAARVFELLNRIKTEEEVAGKPEEKPEQPAPKRKKKKE